MIPALCEIQKANLVLIFLVAETTFHSKLQGLIFSSKSQSTAFFSGSGFNINNHRLYKIRWNLKSPKFTNYANNFSHRTRFLNSSFFTKFFSGKNNSIEENSAFENFVWSTEQAKKAPKV